MQNIITRIFNTGKITPPKSVLKAFISSFGQSFNIEWHKEKNAYEAVFYIEESEHIALFSSEGILLEQKRNLLLQEASEAVASQAAQVGELMNLIEIDRGGVLLYEIIARDGYLDRYYILLDAHGNMLEKKKL
jgi:hypothetical protein